MLKILVDIITFMHLADAFIQSDSTFRLYIFLSVCVFPGNWTHNLCAANTKLYHWATGIITYVFALKKQMHCIVFCQVFSVVY